MLRKCKWERQESGHEWRLVGDGKDFFTAEVQKEIDEYFSTNHLFVITDRHHSREVAAQFAAENVAGLVSRGAVVLCEKDFRRFMQFNPIGVSRRGVVAT